MVKGAQKGAAFERRIAKLLGPWWCEDEGAFWRSAGSGARATVVKGIGLHPGDIVPQTEEAANFPCCIETKRREKWNLADFLAVHRDPFKTEVIVFWLESLIECGGDYIPWAIISKNRQSDLLVVDRGFYSTLRAQHLLWREVGASIPRIAVQFPLSKHFALDIVVFSLQSFMKAVDPGDVLGVARDKHYQDYLAQILADADPILSKYAAETKRKLKRYRENKKKRKEAYDKARDLQPILGYHPG